MFFSHLFYYDSSNYFIELLCILNVLPQRTSHWEWYEKILWNEQNKINSLFGLYKVLYEKTVQPKAVAVAMPLEYSFPMHSNNLK